VDDGASSTRSTKNSIKGIIDNVANQQSSGIIDFDMFEIGQMCLDRLSEALMLLHVKGREPAVIQQATEAPSGKFRAFKKTGNRSGVYRINIDPVEFRVLVSKRAEHIRHAFENPNLAGYGVKGLAFYKRHERRLPSGEITEVSPYAKCDDDAVRIEATKLLLALEQYTLQGHEELKEQTSIKLARMIEEWGAAQTKARLLQGPVSKVQIVEPRRNNPPAPEAKTDHAPNG
ncbi:MAG: hypothetical protein K2Q32_02230, partial [Alphaproteobacteria bacterium]|nr:hypothetical protein [Alphaproteobacteria bacterium]